MLNKWIASLVISGSALLPLLSCATSCHAQPAFDSRPNSGTGVGNGGILVYRISLEEHEIDLASIRVLRADVSQMLENAAEKVESSRGWTLSLRWQANSHVRTAAATLSLNLARSGEVRGGWSHLSRWRTQRLALRDTLNRVTEYSAAEGDAVQKLVQIRNILLGTLSGLESEITRSRDFRFPAAPAAAGNTRAPHPDNGGVAVLGVQAE